MMQPQPQLSAHSTQLAGFVPTADSSSSGSYGASSGSSFVDPFSPQTWHPFMAVASPAVSPSSTSSSGAASGRGAKPTTAAQSAFVPVPALVIEDSARNLPAFDGSSAMSDEDRALMEAVAAASAQLSSSEIDSSSSANGAPELPTDQQLPAPSNSLNRERSHCAQGAACRDRSCANLHPCPKCANGSEWLPIEAFGIAERTTKVTAAGQRYLICIQHRTENRARKARKKAALFLEHEEALTDAAPATFSTVPLTAADSVLVPASSDSSSSSSQTAGSDDALSSKSEAKREKCTLEDCTSGTCDRLHQCTHCRAWQPLEVFGIADCDTGKRKAGERFLRCEQHRIEERARVRARKLRAKLAKAGATAETDTEAEPNGDAEESQDAAATAENSSAQEIIAQIQPINERCSANCVNHLCALLHPCTRCAPSAPWFPVSVLGLSVTSGGIRRYRSCPAHREHHRAYQARKREPDQESANGAGESDVAGSSAESSSSNAAPSDSEKCDTARQCRDANCPLLHPCRKCSGVTKWQPISAFGIADKNTGVIKQGERFATCIRHRASAAAVSTPRASNPAAAKPSVEGEPAAAAIEACPDGLACVNAKCTLSHARTLTTNGSSSFVPSVAMETDLVDSRRKCALGQACKDARCEHLHPCRYCYGNDKWQPVSAFGIAHQRTSTREAGDRYVVCAHHREERRKLESNKKSRKRKAVLSDSDDDGEDGSESDSQSRDDEEFSPKKKRRVELSPPAESSANGAGEASFAASGSASASANANADACDKGQACNDSDCPRLHPCSKCKSPPRVLLPVSAFGLRPDGVRFKTCSNCRGRSAERRKALQRAEDGWDELDELDDVELSPMKQPPSSSSNAASPQTARKRTFHQADAAVAAPSFAKCTDSACVDPDCRLLHACGSKMCGRWLRPDEFGLRRDGDRCKFCLRCRQKLTQGTQHARKRQREEESEEGSVAANSAATSSASSALSTAAAAPMEIDSAATELTKDSSSSTASSSEQGSSDERPLKRLRADDPADSFAVIPATANGQSAQATVVSSSASLSALAQLAARAWISETAFEDS